MIPCESTDVASSNQERRRNSASKPVSRSKVGDNASKGCLKADKGPWSEEDKNPWKGCLKSADARGRSEDTKIPSKACLKAAVNSGENKATPKGCLKPGVKDGLSQAFISPVIKEAAGRSPNVDHVMRSFGNKSQLYENKIQSLESRLQAALASAEENAQKYEQASRKLLVTESELVNIEDKSKDLELKIAMKKKDDDAKDEEVRILKAKFASLEQDLDFQINDVKSVNEKLKESNETIKSYELKVKSLEGQLRLREGECDRFEEELKAKRDLLDSKSLELEGAYREVGLLKSELDKIEETRNSLNLRLKTVNNENADQETKIRDLESLISQLQEDKTKEQEKSDDRRGKAEFDSKRAMFESTTTSVEETKELCDACEELKSKVENINEELLAYKKTITCKEDEMDRLHVASRAMKEDQGKLDLKVDELLSNIREKEATMISYELEISSLKNKNMSLLQNIDSIEVKIKEDCDTMKAQVHESEKLELSLKSLEYKMCEIEDKSAKLNELCVELKLKNNSLEEDLRNKDRLLLQTEESLKQKEDLLNKARISLKTVEDDNESIMFDKKSLEKQLLKNDELLEKISKSKEEDKVKMLELELSLEKAEKSLEVVKLENAKLEDDLSSLNEKHNSFLNQTNLDVEHLMNL